MRGRVHARRTLKGLVADLRSFINSQAEYLKYSIIENNAVWKNLYDYTWPNYNIWGNYENEVQALKYFLSERLNWLNNNLPK